MILSYILTSTENLPRSVMRASTDIILRINVLASSVEANSEKYIFN